MMSQPTMLAVFLSLAFALAPAITYAQAVVAPAPTPTADAVEQSVRPGINEGFLAADLDVAEWLARFEVESREVFLARRAVLAQCELEPGDRVADIGAGTGFYSLLFAEAVGESGWVFGVDIAPPFLEHLNQRAAENGFANVTAVLGGARSIHLPPESVDLVFICDTYHHFEYPRSTLASIYRALDEGGTLVLIDFERIPGVSREWLLSHVRAGKQEFRSEIEAAGFEFVAEPEIEAFEENYLLKFRKPVD